MDLLSYFAGMMTILILWSAWKMVNAITIERPYKPNVRTAPPLNIERMHVCGTLGPLLTRSGTSSKELKSLGEGFQKHD
jgi:hypothetical protein